MDLETAQAGVMPRRLPAWTKEQYQDPPVHGATVMPSGVRLLFRTDARSGVRGTHLHRAARFRPPPSADRDAGVAHRRRPGRASAGARGQRAADGGPRGCTAPPRTHSGRSTQPSSPDAVEVQRSARAWRMPCAAGPDLLESTGRAGEADGSPGWRDQPGPARATALFALFRTVDVSRTGSQDAGWRHVRLDGEEPIREQWVRRCGVHSQPVCGSPREGTPAVDQ